MHMILVILCCKLLPSNAGCRRRLRDSLTPQNLSYLDSSLSGPALKMLGEPLMRSVFWGRPFCVAANVCFTASCCIEKPNTNI